MRISFQHANPAQTHHESTVVFVELSDREYTFLIDAGQGTADTVDDETLANLDAVFLTHAHLDHYIDLGAVLKSTGDIPVYASSTTARLLPIVFAEADRYQSLGGAEQVADALTPIDGWRNLVENIDVGCLPAGHTPGAASFFFRFDDYDGGEVPTLLATGDFTQRHVAETPGLQPPVPGYPDIVLLNASTATGFTDTATELFDTVLERAVGGSEVVVTAGALTGVHVAWGLGHLIDRFNRSVSVHLVGQTAKLYRALEYDVPCVEVTETFENTNELLSNGTITIAGPESPTQGSAQRLYDAVEDQPNALFAQVFTSGADPVSTSSCATYTCHWSNHPTEETLRDCVEAWLPKHLIVKHIDIPEGQEFAEGFDEVLHWTNDDSEKHVLYSHGTWKSPDFLAEDHGTRILTRNYRSRNPAPLLDEDVDDLPDISWTRSDQTLSEEGIAVSTLAEAYEESAKNQPSGTHATEQPPTEEPETTNKTAVPETHDREELLSEIEENQGAIESVENHLTTVETAVDEMRDTTPTADALESRFGTLESKLSALETQLEEVPETIRKDRLGEQRVPGVVVRQDDLALLRLHPEEADSLDNLEHGDEVEVVITETSE